MANKLIKHNWNNQDPPMAPIVEEPDKSKSISELSLSELYRMMERLNAEKDLESTIRNLKLNSGEQDILEKPFKIDTKTPINQLYHYGIPGMKWGVRRYQNPDGTRTAAGKKRDARHTSRVSDDYTQSRKTKAKGTRGMSNEDLRKLNERLQLEETYKRLTQSDIKKSESWVQESIKTIGKNSLVNIGTGILTGSAKILIKQLSPELASAGFGMKDKDKK